MADKKIEKPGHNLPEEMGQVNETVPPAAKGTLVVHVFDKVQTKRTPVRNASVRLFTKDANGKAQEFSGKTDRDGVYKETVQPATWDIVVEAFGNKIVEQRDVRPKCEVDAEINVAIMFQLTIGSADIGATAERSYKRIYPAGTIIEATAAAEKSYGQPLALEFAISHGNIIHTEDVPGGKSIHIDPEGYAGPLSVTARAGEGNGFLGAMLSDETSVSVAGRPPVPVTGSMNVGLRRTASTVTPDLPLWVVIRNSTEGLSFKNYQRYMDVVLCNASGGQTNWKQTYEDLKKRRCLPFTDAEAYRLLKVATEAFLMVQCGVDFPREFNSEDLDVLVGRTGVEGLGSQRFEQIWTKYLGVVNGTGDPMLPYLALIARKFPSVGTGTSVGLTNGEADICADVISRKLTAPCLVELIWSYWHEEAMLVQTLNAISIRFQNRRGGTNGDPLANMEIDPLRPLNNLLWGYIQDEQHRLTVVRRAYEYDHQYGLRLQGRAIPGMRTADSRSQFLRAFHNLLHLCSVFFQQDDDTTVISDGFPVLNALKEVHLILSQGAHNQFGDLPATARIEMLMQQWMLARPEFREFLPTRAMVAYPEPWMDRVDSMKKLQGWSDVNVLHFRDLGVFGEKLLLTMRYGSWVDVHDPDQARNWLRYWRPEIQGYIHAYRAVTGVDVSAEPVNSTLPSVLLRERLARQPRPRVC